jgi:hypothetical protein
MPEPFVAQLGRIGGKLLSDNLIRDGVDLTFRNNPLDADLLYLNVTDDRIGVNIDVPVYDLDVNSAIKSIFGQADNNAYIDNIIIQNNIFTTATGPIEIEPAGPNPTVIFDRLGTIDGSYQPILYFTDNVLYSENNANIVFNPSGSGSINLNSTTNITGNLGVTGNIGLSGDLRTNSNIFIGDSPLDVVVVQTDFTQDINPGTTLSYDLGSVSKRWSEAHIVDWRQINNIRPQNALISDQLLVDGFGGNVITTVQSNDDVIINSATGNNFVESININGNTISNLLNVPNIDPTLVAAGINLAAAGDPTASVWTTSVSGRELTVTGPGSVVESFRTAQLGDIRNDLDNPNILNADDANKVLSIGAQNPATLNEELWYHTVIKPYVLNDPILYAQYGNGASTNNDSITIQSTGIGYVKIQGTNGFVIPFGTTSERPYTEVGETRWNTDLELLECFDGNVYIVATGPGAVVTTELMTELAITRALVLG